MTNEPSRPLDVVVSGYAYENATAAIASLESGRSEKWLSTEMMCTLDNFIDVVLFSDRIFLTGCTDLQNNAFIPREPRYQAGDASRKLFEEENIFFRLQGTDESQSEVFSSVSSVSNPVDFEASPLFIITCRFPKRQLTVLQELVYMDIFFIEHAISQCGAGRFKPVFPGDHLYLGLRRDRLPLPRTTHSMSDVPGRRLRALVEKKMNDLNAFVAQGAPMLPGLPPIFASRILQDCENRSDFVRVLLRVRNSPAMRGFRAWLEKCATLSQSASYADRLKASKALKKLEQFSPEGGGSADEFGIDLLKIAIDVAKHDPLSMVADLASPVMKYLGGVPLRGLKQFGGKTANPEEFERYIERVFDDRFNRHEMDFIATLLKLPNSLTGWETQEATFGVTAGRLHSGAPPLARPCVVQTASLPHVDNASEDFEDLWNKGEKVTHGDPRQREKWDADKA